MVVLKSQNIAGQKIWETPNCKQGWEGDNYETGVSIWLIQYRNSIGEFIE